jgi:TP901 family phage tail tape measure protein
MLNGIEGVMNLAAASGEDLATTSDIVTDALTAFGLSASDTGHFADVLAAASSNANTNVSMMGETFKYCAPIAGALGFSVEDTAQAIGLMANAGIKSSQAGTSLRTIMNNLSGEVKICGSAVGEVTVATTNADGSMRELSDILADCRTAFAGLTESEKASAAESLVGKNAMSGFLALMNAGEEDINKLSGAIADCDGTAQSMADTMNDNLEGQLTILKSQLQELAISFGEILLPAIKSIVSFLQGFVDVLNSMPDGMKQTIVTIALVVAALGPVLIIVGKVITAVGTVLTIVPKVAGVINTVKTAFTALNAVMMANPIALIIAAIAALVAAFIYLWNTSEEFRKFWINLWNNAGDVVVSAGNGIKNTVGGIYNVIRDGFTKAVDFIKNLGSSAYGWGADIINGIVDGIRSCVSNVKDAVGSVADTIKSYLHFSVPDEGPLVDYESWMPDFMKELAEGIDRSRHLVADAVDGVAGDMVISPQFSMSQMAMAGGGSVSGADLSSLAGAVRDAVSSLNESGNGGYGDIVIPVYLGGTMLDEVIVNAQQRANLRSGGR